MRRRAWMKLLGGLGVAAALGSPAAESLVKVAGGASQDGARLSITLRDGRLSVDARERPWTEVLSELRRKTGIVLHLRPRPEGLVTRVFTDLPVERALRRLFGLDAHYIYRYGAPGARPAALSAVPSEVWILGGAASKPAGVVATVASSRAPDRSRPRVPTDEPTTLVDPLAHILALADGDPPATIHGLLGAVRDPDPAVRGAAAEALGDLRPDGGEDALASLLVSDPDPEVRGAAAVALTKLGSPAALATVRRSLEDHEPAVRLRIVRTLAEVGGKGATAILRDALRDADGKVARAAAAAVFEPEKDQR